MHLFCGNFYKESLWNSCVFCPTVRRNMCVKRVKSLHIITSTFSFHIYSTVATCFIRTQRDDRRICGIFCWGCALIVTGQEQPGKRTAFKARVTCWIEINTRHKKWTHNWIMINRLLPTSTFTHFRDFNYIPQAHTDSVTHRLPQPLLLLPLAANILRVFAEEIVEMYLERKVWIWHTICLGCAAAFSSSSPPSIVAVEYRHLRPTIGQILK